MNDVGETVDSANDYERHSRRDRFKDVVLRTKGKWKKEKERVPQQQADFQLSDDVNDFLAAGRKFTATTTVRQVTDDVQRLTPSPRPSTSDSHNSGQPSPRGVTVPKLDISQSRWPNARTVIASAESRPDPRFRNSDHLSPEYLGRHTYERSHSFNSALAKKGSRPRGLSVTFLNGPPTVIGEGGDESQIPPNEISKAHKQRSRSLSPYLDRPSSQISTGSSGQSPVRRKPVPPPSPPGGLVNADREDSMFQPRPVRRAQTGFNNQIIERPSVTETLERQLQDAFKLGGGLQQASNPFADPLLQQRDRRQPEPTRQVHTNKPVVVSSQTGYDQRIYNPAQQHGHQKLPPVHHPDLQQSRETSIKPAPPKMQNFYAQMNGQTFDPASVSEKRLSTSQLREATPDSQLRLALDAPTGPRRSPNGFPQRVQNTPQKPPEGWI